MTEKVFDPTVLTKNRDRLMKHEVAELFWSPPWTRHGGEDCSAAVPTSSERPAIRSS